MKENKRVIKFRRAYFKDENKKEFSHFSEWGVNVGQTSFTSPAQNNFAFYFEDCQFTGLLDKQGKEIYESDVVKVGEDLLLVNWNEKFASFCLDKNGWLHSHWFGESCYPQYCEVVGNKFEHASLLTPPTSKQ